MVHPEDNIFPETPRPVPQSKQERGEGRPASGRNLIFTYVAILFFPVLAFIIYSNSLDSNFLLDDYDNIEVRQAIKMTRLNWDSLIKAGTDGLLQRRPLPNITFALNYYFGKLSTRGYHIVNILIHALNGVLLYLLFLRTFQTPVLQKKYVHAGFIPLAAATIWLVHPVQVQSVTYIVQRMNTMATMFYLLAMLCYVHARLTASNRNRFIFFGLTGFAILLGLGSKETVSSIPYSLLLFEFVFFQNCDLRWLKKNLPAIALMAASFLACAFLYLGENPISKISSSYESYTYTMGQRIITEFRVVLFYLKQILLAHPSNLNILHHFPVSTSLLQPVSTILSLLAIAGVVLWATFVARKEPLFFFAALWYFGNLVIESSVVNLEIIFEHRSYLPSTFVILAIVIYASRAVPYQLARKALFIGLIALLGFWTYGRNSVWADEIAFWQDCITKNPKANRAYNELAIAYEREGQKNKAIQTYYQGIRVNNNDWRLHYNLGDAFDSLGETAKAIEQFELVTKIMPGFAPAHFRLGTDYARIENFQKAFWYTREALRLDPTLTEARNKLALLQKLANHGRSQK